MDLEEPPSDEQHHIAVPLAPSEQPLTTQSLTNPVGRVRIDSATSLWRAAEHGDLGRLKMLLKQGHDVNAWCEEAGWKHKSPLSAAVEGNEPLAVRLLLRKGANPNLQDGDSDRYPLHWASAYGDNDECAELLVQAGAALDARDARGHTPLEFARGSADGRVHRFARFGSALLGRNPRRDKVVAVLERAAARQHKALSPPSSSSMDAVATAAANGADSEGAAAAAGSAAVGAAAGAAVGVAAGAASGWTPARAKERLGGAFWKAAASGDVPTLQKCLDQYEQPIDQPRPAPVSRMSALAIAAFEGRLEAVRFLLDRRANPNVQESEGGFTPLHFCAHSGDHDEVARLLLARGANALLAKLDGDTPAEYASYRRQNREKVGRLLAHAADRQTAQDALREALAALERPVAWRKPSAAQLEELTRNAQAAGVEDEVLLGHGDAAAARLRVEEKEAAASGWGAWALSTVGSVFIGMASEDEVEAIRRDQEARSQDPSAGVLSYELEDAFTSMPPEDGTDPEAGTSGGEYGTELREVAHVDVADTGEEGEMRQEHADSPFDAMHVVPPAAEIGNAPSVQDKVQEQEVPSTVDDAAADKEAGS